MKSLSIAFGSFFINCDIESGYCQMFKTNGTFLWIGTKDELISILQQLNS